MSADSVKRGLNAYRYCDNDPVNYVDPTGEIPGILIGAGIGGVFGGLSGFVGSAVSQVISGEDFSMRKALGGMANGAAVGTVKGAMLGSGAGIAAMFAGDFLAGTAGSTLEQMFTGGRVDVGESILGGVNNAVSQLLYGNTPLKGVGDAFKRGGLTGAAAAGINNIAGALGIGGTGEENFPGGGGYSRQPRGMMPDIGTVRDPRRMCGAPDPFDLGSGLGSSRGYQYGRSHGGAGAGSTQESGGFSLGSFLKDMAIGAVVGGLGSAGFYGAGRAVEVLRGSVGGRKNDGNTYYIPRDENGKVIPLKRQMVNGRDIPLPDSAAHGKPHTVLGGSTSAKTGADYRQSSTFGGGTWPSANGYDVPLYETHWYNHGRGDHAIPHKHIYYYDSSNGGWQRGNHSLF